MCNKAAALVMGNIGVTRTIAILYLRIFFGLSKPRICNVFKLSMLVFLAKDVTSLKIKQLHLKAHRLLRS